jgi:predicted nucleic acid-binding protein
MILTDTSFIIDVMKGNHEALVKLNEMRKTGATAMVSTVTLYELYVGVSRVRRPLEEKEKILKATSRMSTIGFDEKSAREAGRVQGDLKARGEMIDIPDILIAGIARACGFSVLTRNKAHFNKVIGLSVDTY